MGWKSVRQDLAAKQPSCLTRLCWFQVDGKGTQPYIYIHVSILPRSPLPSRLLCNIEQSSLGHAVGPCWVTHLKYSSVYTSLPKSLDIPSPFHLTGDCKFARTRISFQLLLLLFSRSVVWLFCDPMDCSPPGSPVRGISQVRTQEWVAISFFRGYCWPRDWAMSPAWQADSSPLNRLERQGGKLYKALSYWCSLAVSEAYRQQLENQLVGNPLQYSCLEKSMDRGVWRAEVHGITWLSM